MLRHFLLGGIVLEAFLVAVICSLWRVLASEPAFASFHLHRPGRTWSSESLRWRMLCRRSDLADALLPSSLWLKFGLADALPPWLVVRVDALPHLLGRRPLHSGRCCLC